MEMKNGKPTEVNPRSTQINLYHEGESNTVVNPAVIDPSGGNRTAVNPRVALEPERYAGASREAGKNLGMIIDGYKLLSVMGTVSGEADLYVCEDQTNQKYCLKHYKRIGGVSAEVRAALQNINDKNIAKLVGWSYWNERIYEVWPLFTNGSLTGQHPEEQMLKSYIEQMNHALSVIHQNGIVHQDIKPANFMHTGYECIALIDFGTSAIIGDTADQRTHVTQIGRTIDYAAPEVLLSRLFWPASDYYSLGVTVYELMLGSTPYANYSEDMLQRKIDDIRDTRIPNLDKLPQKYQDLVSGLLQYEKEKRWGYIQVCDWLRGDYEQWKFVLHPIDEGKEFRFDGDIYRIPSDFPKLVLNLAYKWNAGKRLFDRDGRSSLLCKKLVDVDGAEEFYSICNEPKENYEDDDINYFRKLYRLSPELKLFTWKNWQFAGRRELGEAILSSLWENGVVDKTTKIPSCPRDVFGEDPSEIQQSLPSKDEIIYWVKKHVISQYLKFIGEAEMAAAVFEWEKTAENSTLNRYRIAYTLSGSTKLLLPAGEFSNINAFLQCVERKAQESKDTKDIDTFLRFCHNEIYDGKSVNDSVQAWLECMGMEQSLKYLTGENYDSQPIMQQNARPVVSASASRAEKEIKPVSVPHAKENREASKKVRVCKNCGGRFSYSASKCPYCGSSTAE